MAQEQRVKAWHSPDLPVDIKEVRPVGQLLVGRDTPVGLTGYSIRQRGAGVSLNLYSKKRNHGVPNYGITVDPETAKGIGMQLLEAAQAVLKRQGKLGD